jgi:bifunctional DNA-binding transcriptional regulator/antitoxin component of YhaV-PrlF toxin-antitoxin module
MLRKLGKSNQVVIPKEIIPVWGLKQDDYLDIFIDNNIKSPEIYY